MKKSIMTKSGYRVEIDTDDNKSDLTLTNGYHAVTVDIDPSVLKEINRAFAGSGVTLTEDETRNITQREKAADEQPF